MSLSRESNATSHLVVPRLSTSRLAVTSAPTRPPLPITVGPAGFNPPATQASRGRSIEFTLSGTSGSIAVTVEFNGQPTTELFGTSSFTVSSDGPSSQQVQHTAEVGRTYTLSLSLPASGFGLRRSRPDVPGFEVLRGTIEVSP